VPVAGRPLVAWCLEAFAAAPSVSGAVIVAPPGAEGRFTELAPEGLVIEVVAGGATRAESVARGLEAARGEVVAVHDAARPLVTAELIEALVARLTNRVDASGVIAAAPVTDTIKRVGEAGEIASTEDRSVLWAAQTPQVFRTEALREAHGATGSDDATDDAMLVERVGGIVLVEPAPAETIKVTTPADLKVAELLLARR
jgi:2-C-methyl-D-erythritol 4-phosphate cytidylyltransferase